MNSAICFFCSKVRSAQGDDGYVVGRLSGARTSVLPSQLRFKGLGKQSRVSPNLRSIVGCHCDKGRPRAVVLKATRLFVN